MNSTASPSTRQVNDLEVIAAQFRVRQELRAAQCDLASRISSQLVGRAMLEAARLRLRVAQRAYDFSHQVVA